jgi:hypothetical protein
MPPATCCTDNTQPTPRSRCFGNPGLEFHNAGWQRCLLRGAVSQLIATQLSDQILTEKLDNIEKSGAKVRLRVIPAVICRSPREPVSPSSVARLSSGGVADSRTRAPAFTTT